jgi:3D (Asp-Asp-Asp) domain-containing protein
VADALGSAGIALLPADLTEPGLTAQITNGEHLRIRRATPVTIAADGARHDVRTQQTTVADALREQGLALGPADKVEPPLASPLKAGLPIQVIRVKEAVATLEDVIAYETRYVADAEMEMGTQTTVQPGAPGLRKRDVTIGYEDGREVRRLVTREWVEREPQTAEIHYGTNVVYRTLATAGGTQQYWKTMRVWATWYSPANAGKPRSSPGYGRTALGYEARKGVMAVDPRVIPLNSHVYVPGYGVAVAGDTGGGVRGNVIDLAFGDDEEQDWISRYIDIYFLAPGPDPSQIRPPSP